MTKKTNGFKLSRKEKDALIKEICGDFNAFKNKDDNRTLKAYKKER